MSKEFQPEMTLQRQAFSNDASLKSSTARSMEPPPFQLLSSVPNEPEDIPDAHVAYNYLVHLAYADAAQIQGDSKASEILGALGYNAEQIYTIPGRGGFSMLVIPSPAESAVPPIVAFRGTDELKDWNANLCYSYVGKNQFRKNRDTIEEVLNLFGQPAVLLGHSLGGALAQRAAIEFGSMVQEVVTYQAPGVLPQELHGNFDREGTPDATHYIATNDVVDRAGFSHLPGDVVMIDENAGVLDSHTNPILWSEDFNPHRDRLGIGQESVGNTYSEAFGHGVRSSSEDDTITRYDAYPTRKRSPVQAAELARLGLATSGGCAISRPLSGLHDLGQPKSEVPQGLLDSVGTEGYVGF